MTVKQTLRLILSGAIALTATLLIPSVAKAVIVSDPIGDFLPTYMGAKGGDLDVVSAEVSLTGGNQLFFSATLAAAVGTTPEAFYVFGLDRGQGIQRLVAGTPPIGLGVFFDSVVILRPDGTAQFTDFVNSANSTALRSGSSISGSQISGTFNLSLFPPTGFFPAAYTWNLWPRVSNVPGNFGISDFAPNASNASVASVASVAIPEPGSIGGLLVAAGCVVFFKKRMSKR